MMSIAAAIVRSWTWAYTFPLAAEARRRRQCEVESDLWECAHDAARRTGASHVVLRALLGVPDDLLWAAEQLPTGARAPRLATTMKAAAVLIAASGLVATASGTTIDPARDLSVNVTQSGWTVVSRTSADMTVAPAFAFTLTNTGDHATSAVQVNALFSWTGRNPGSLGTAFSPAIGWRGLPVGSTSQSIVLCPRAGWWRQEQGIHAEVDRRAAQTALSEATVKLFAHYGRGWIVLGEYPIPARLVQP